MRPADPASRLLVSICPPLPSPASCVDARRENSPLRIGGPEGECVASVEEKICNLCRVAERSDPYEGRGADGPVRVEFRRVGIAYAYAERGPAGLVSDLSLYRRDKFALGPRSEEHTSELQSHHD